MDMVACEVEKTNNEVMARVHDAIFVRHKISSYDKERIEDLICKHSRIRYWSLKEEAIKRYEGISEETLADEEAHRQHMAAEAELAKGYVGQFSASD
jgi:hypothetical protein